MEVAPATAPVSVIVPDDRPSLTPNLTQNAVGKLIAGARSFLWPETEKPWYPFLSVIASTGRPLEELIGNIVGLAIASSVTVAQGTLR